MKIYGTDAEGPKVCPGESDCERFQSAAGKTHREKEQNACIPCELFSTKLIGGRRVQQRNDRLVGNAFAIRNERLTGYPRDTNFMTSLEFQTLIVIEQLIEQQEIWLRRELSEVMKAVFGGSK